MNDKYYTLLLRTAACFGMTGVAFGAFGAHFLKSRISPDDLEVIKTAVLYLFIHTLAMLAVVIIGRSEAVSRTLKGAGILFALGIVLFSGSLFYIGTRDVSGMQPGGIGFLTPVGGLCFIAGWVLLFAYSFTKKNIN